MEKTCSFEGCDKPPKSSKQPLCTGHRQQQWRDQELRPLRKRTSPKEVERLRAQGLKKCFDCDQVKPFEDFNRHKSSKDGRHPQCRACQVEYSHQYHEANREERLERSRQWRQDNIDKNRAKAARYRARKLEATTEPFTAEDVKRIWGESPMCVYCQERPAEHLDHFMPLALGGEHSLRNASWPACAPCNLSKHDKHPSLFQVEQMTEEEQAAFVAALEARMNEETER
mgnify:CR=1 FL=1